MKPVPQPGLLQAFLATDYQMRVGSQWQTLPAPGNTSDRRLWLPATLGTDDLALIIADNPRAEQQPERNNRRARWQLRRWVRTHQTRLARAYPHGDWPVEHGLLIAGLRRVRAQRLARRLEQRAWLYYWRRADGRYQAELNWLEY